MSDYEAPELTELTIMTASGRELDVLAEALYGLSRCPAVPGCAIEETDYSLRARCMMSQAEKDRAELAWWRSQFATRFPTGDLPKPGTPLIGKRFRLLGIDLAAPGGERVGINLVAENEVIGHVSVDPQALYPNFTEALTKLIADVTRFFMRITSSRKARGLMLCRNGCGATTVPDDGQTSWLCASCGSNRKPTEPARSEPFIPEHDTFDFLKP